MNKHYRNGDEISYTGNSEMVHGELCWEFIYVDGTKAGLAGWTYKSA